MAKKLLAVVMAVCMILTVLTACGGTGAKKDDGKADGEIDKALENLEKLEDETGVTIGKGVKDLLEDIDEADLDAAAAAAKDDVKAIADLPEGWEKDEDSPLLLSATNGTRLLSVSNTWVPSGVKDAVELAEQNKEQMKEYFPDATISEVESVKLGEYDGALLNFEYAITKSMVQIQVYFYFFKGDKAYMIQGAYMTDDEGGADDVKAAMAAVKIE